MRYLFASCTFDLGRRELRRGDEVVPIAPQVFDLLDYLIRNRERVVTKDDIFSAVWNGRIVSEAALTTRLNAARNAIGDTGEKQLLIKTLPRKGFRFVGAVQEERQVSPVEQDSSAVRGEVTAATSPPAPRLSIVVLPFANLSGDPEQDSGHRIGSFGTYRRPLPANFNLRVFTQPGSIASLRPSLGKVRPPPELRS